MSLRTKRNEFLEQLESRRLLTVTPQIQFLMALSQPSDVRRAFGCAGGCGGIDHAGC
jgi:hypothetical protein